MQHYSLLKSVESGHEKERVAERSNTFGPQTMVNTHRIGRLIDNSPVPEQHTLEQIDNSFTENTPKKAAAIASSSNQRPHNVLFNLNLSLIQAADEAEHPEGLHIY